MSRQPAVAVIILHWGDPADTAEALKSLSSQEYPLSRIFLVDQMGDYTGYLPKNASHLKPGKNLGFSGGNNLALKEVLAGKYEYVLLFNNDASGEPGFLKILVEAMENAPEAAAAGPTIVYADPPDRIWYAGGELIWHRGLVRHLGLETKLGDLELTDPQEVSFVTGCSILMRVEAIRKIGALDDRYFVYTEDADWCARAIRADYKLLWVPRSLVTHQISNAFGVNSPGYLYYNFRNYLLFIRSNIPWQWRPLAWLTLLTQVLKELIKLVTRYRRNYFEYLRLILRAFLDNARRRYGQL